MLVPESAHGTNPATAALLGYRVVTVPARDDGTVDPEEVKKRLSPDVAAIMLTNPNTCGLFERDVMAIADAVHAAGAYFYADGANFNAIVGKVRPGRSRRRRHAHQPAQDVLDAARRWRAGCRSGGAVGGARAVHAGCPTSWRRQTALRWSSMPKARRQALRPHVCVPWSDGHVRAGAGLHAEPRQRRHAAGVGRRGAQRQLRARLAFTT